MRGAVVLVPPCTMHHETIVMRRFLLRRGAGTWMLLVTLLVLGAETGCATEDPPSRDAFRQESGIQQLALDEPWRAGGDAGEIRDDWLASFDDAQLNLLVDEAMRGNPDLRVVATKVELAAQYVELAKAALWPAVKLAGSGGFKMGGGDVSSALKGVALGVSWEPDLWGRIRYGRNATQATQASIEADYEFARQSLAATVAKCWFTASETWLQTKLTDEMIGTAQELVTLARERWRVGVGSELDVSVAKVNLGTFRESATQVRLAHQHALRAIELLLGRYPAAELAARPDLPALPGPVPVGLPIAMLERRPDMVAAERRVAEAFNRVGEAKAARLPSTTALHRLKPRDLISRSTPVINTGAAAWTHLRSNRCTLR